MAVLTVWDFDDVLVAASPALERLTAQAEHADVPADAWWNDPDRSTLAARRTRPIAKVWARVCATEGTQIILTGRVLPAVLFWLNRYAGRTDDVGRGIARIRDVICVQGEGWPGDTMAERKAAFLNHVATKRDVHVYDDDPDVLRRVTAPRATTVLVRPPFERRSIPPT